MRNVLFLLVLFAVDSAAGIIIGGPAQNVSGFPFGYAASGFAGTDFKEIYAASAFPNTPITITGIGLFAQGGEYRFGTYTFYFSTTPSPAAWFSESPFSIITGADNQVFGAYALSGAAPTGEVIFDGGPFFYDPTEGNLLLDIQYSGPGGGDLSTGAKFDDSGSFNFPYAGETVGVSWDYGGSFFNHGLVTEFQTAAVPEPSSFLLLCGGLLVLIQNRRNRVGSRIVEGGPGGNWCRGVRAPQ